MGGSTQSMGYLIDSSVLIDFERQQSDLQTRIKGREEDMFFLSVISASELLHGVHRAIDPHIKARRYAFVEAILERFPILSIDVSIARQHARLWAEMKNQGAVIGLHDSWLAATCLAYGLTLITLNRRDFERVAGLSLECWL